MARHRFTFAFEPLLRPLALAVGVTPATAAVEVGDGELRVRFGPWRLSTPTANIVGAEITGPYSFAKVAGPAHLSFADRGITFATNRQRGACLQLAEPVRGIDPFGRLRHPGVTMTVSRPEELLAHLGWPVPS